MKSKRILALLAVLIMALGSFVPAVFHPSPLTVVQQAGNCHFSEDPNQSLPGQTVSSARSTQNTRMLKNTPQSSAAQINQLWQKRTSFGRHGLEPDRYVPNEILVKYKKEAAEVMANASTGTGKFTAQTSSTELDRLNQKYKARDIRPLAKEFKEKQANLNRPQSKDKAQRVSQDNTHLKRLQRAERNVKNPGLERIYKMTVEPQAGKSLADVVADYNTCSEVEYAELNYIVSVSDTFPNDPLFEKQWAMHNIGQNYPPGSAGTEDSDIDAPHAWDFFTGNHDIVVAVIDTGVDYRHRDLLGNMWTDPNGYYGYDFFNDDNDPHDDHGHGTHCAGIIGAAGNNGLDMAGVCWNVKIMAIKFLNAGGQGSTDDAIEGILYAVNHGADVLSNSWGGQDYSQALQDAIDYAISQGVVVVAAAGNEGNIIPQYPANYEHVLSVAATDSDDKKAFFSTYGSWVDIAAPGVDILSLRADGTSLGDVYDNYLTVLSGTSMACPHVSGACALLLSWNPTLSNQEVFDVLMQTVDPVADGNSICISGGRLNIANALSAANPSRGRVSFDRTLYPCSGQIGIRLADMDLAGNMNVTVEVTSTGGDSERVALHETENIAGVFTAIVAHLPQEAYPDNGIIEASDGHQIIVSCQDADDGSGNSVLVQDTAVIDCVAPYVIDIRIDVMGSIITLDFDTDEESTAVIRAGDVCKGSYPVIVSDPLLATHHTVQLKGLRPETAYYFELELSDRVGNTAVDDQNGTCYQFMTSAPLGNIDVPKDFKTIQDAILHAWDGDTIRVADGIYTGLGNYDIDFQGLAITVKSENGPDHCIIDCQMKGRGVFFHHGETASSVLDGFTIKNGCPAADISPTINFDAWLGGGIYCKNSYPKIMNCKIMDNMSPYWGGGICILNDSFDETVSIFNCTMIRNYAVLWGGGVYTNAGVEMIQSVLSQNLAGNGGGGINCNARTVIEDCIITDNSIYHLVANTGYGGGVFASGDFTMNRSVVCGNTGYYGGGLFYFDQSAVISNCLFNENSAMTGGGICYYGDQFELTNCTLTKNTANYSGGGVSYYQSFVPNITVIENSIVWDNHADVEGEQIAYYEFDSTLTISHSDIQGGESEIAKSQDAVLIWDDTNLDADPNFAFPSDWHLLSGSPCINRGTNNPVGGLAEKDIENNPRMVDEIVDMGACEFNSTAPRIAVSPGVIEFQCIESGPSPAAQSLNIRNCGGGLLSWTIETNSSWLEVSRDSGTSAGQINQVELRINTTSMIPGWHDCLLRVHDVSALNTPQDVYVRLHVSGTFHVPSQYPTIRSAILAARDGDTILVADGTYTGNGNRDIEFLGKDLTVRSEHGPQSCIMDCQGADLSPHRGFAFTEGSNSTISGFTIIRGYVNNDYYAVFPPSQGGGIYSYDSFPIIENCIIEDNFCSAGLIPSAGGGIMVEGSLDSHPVTIRNCIIKDNQTDMFGGGVLGIVPFIVENTIVKNNYSRISGGGIYCFPFYSQGSIRNCILAENSSKFGGGLYFDAGIYMEEIKTYPALTSTIVRDNNASQGAQIAMSKLPDNSQDRAGVSYCDISTQPNDVYVEGGIGIEWGDGNIDLAPLFVDPANDDYHLQKNSPAIDAARPYPDGQVELSDLDGQIRPIDGNYDGLAVSDMGPYEFLPEPSPDPVIAISAWEYNFIAYQNEDNPAGQTLRIWNSGAGTLNWSIQSDCDWLHVVPSSGTSDGQKQDVTIHVDSTGLARGRYTCQLSILDTNAVNSPRTFKVNLQVFIRGQWYIPSEFETVQAAIDKASNGEIIIMSPGTYTENINTLGKNITLTSNAPNDPNIIAQTVIQGDGSNPVIALTGHETACKINGLTLTGGKSLSNGGGIQGNGARVDVSNCIIRGNSAAEQGGGIHGIRGSIVNCTIEGNQSAQGGGVADCNDIINSVISQNQSQDGGGLYQVNGSILGCSIESNTAVSGGGVSQCLGRIENSRIAQNSAQEQGGGLLGIRSPVLNCFIENNRAVLGGGIADANDIFNSVIARNHSDEGGGLYQISGGIMYCTVVSNTALRGAGLSQCRGPIENCIIWANDTGSLYESSMPSFSCIEGDDRGLGNLDVNPEFVNLQAYDYHLSPGSFCIDAGNPSPAILLAADIEGNPRPLDGNNDGNSLSDMGAYETPLSDHPVIGISASEFIFSTQGPDRQILTLWNAGLAPIHYTIDDQQCQWLHVTPTSGTASEGVPHNISLIVNASEIPAGVYECQLIVSDSAAVNSPRMIMVQLKVLKDTIYLTPQDSTIQYSIDYLMEGGTLILADGVYTGPGNRDIDFKGLSATIKSEHGPENCIIDPNGNETTPYRAFVFRNVEDANSILDGLTIINGYSKQPGGAVYCEQSSPTMTNCIFRNNRAENESGGAVYSKGGSPGIVNCVFEANSARLGGATASFSGAVRMMNNVFLSNSAALGGAVYLRLTSLNAGDCVFTQNSANDGGGIYSYESQGQLTGCIFTENFTVLENWNHGGGAVYNYKSPLKLRQCRFENNQGAWEAGAIYNSQSSPWIVGCEFVENQALGNDGGAIFNVAQSDPNIKQCIFQSNTAKSWGGAMRNQLSSPKVENCLFVDNFAIDNGGAIFNYFKCQAAIANCTFTDNDANSNDGNSMFSLNQCRTTVVNSIFRETGPSAVFDDNSTTDISYSDILWPGVGNIDLPPCFRDPNNGDFRLARHSPCIDAGSDIGLDVDLDGNQRPWDFPYIHNNVEESKTDMGCYEFVNQKPISRPGADRTVYAWIDGYAQAVLDASQSVDPDSSILGYTWKWQDPLGNTVFFNGADGIINLQDLAALSAHWLEHGDSYIDIDPNEPGSQGKIDEYDLSVLAESWLSDENASDWNWVCDIAPSTSVKTMVLSAGEHQFELVVNDTIENSEPNQVRVTVVESLQTSLVAVPSILNARIQKGKMIAALDLPRNISIDQLDLDYSLLLIPGNLSAKQAVPVRIGKHVFLCGTFEIGEILQMAGNNKQLIIQVVGRLKSGQFIFGQTKIYIIRSRL